MGIKNISDKIRVSKDRIFYNINMCDIDLLMCDKEVVEV